MRGWIAGWERKVQRQNDARFESDGSMGHPVGHLPCNFVFGPVRMVAAQCLLNRVPRERPEPKRDLEAFSRRLCSQHGRHCIVEYVIPEAHSNCSPKPIMSRNSSSAPPPCDKERANTGETANWASRVCDVGVSS